MKTKLTVLALRHLAGQAKSAGTSEILRTLAAPPRPTPEPAPVTPPRARDRWLGRVTYWGFLLGVALTVATLLGLVMIDSDLLWLSLGKLAVGVALVGEGILLLWDWHGARTHLLGRFRARRRADASLRNALFWRSLGPGLGLLGLIWIAMGVFALAQGAVHLVPGG